MATERKTRGDAGEDFACGYLVGKGYQILERNWRRPWGELDIVALSGDRTLVFIEVKTMQKRRYEGIRPEDQMTRAKLMKFKKIAEFYAGQHPEKMREEKGWRTDVIAVLEGPEGYTATQYENV